MTTLFQEVAGNNDIHRPVNFDPTNYEWIDAVDLCPEPRSFFPVKNDDGENFVGPHGGFNPYHDHYLHMKGLLAASPTSIFNKGERGFQCDHCGAHLRYACIVLHKPTNTHMVMGEDCIKRLDISGKGAFQSQYIRTYAENMREHNRKMAAREKFLADHVGLEDALKFDHRIIKDISDKLTQWGNISDKQIALVAKIAKEETDRKNQVVAEEVLDDAPVGRMQISGKILTIKDVDSFYGVQTKMLLMCEAPKKFKLWVTLPAAISSNAWRGDVVSMTATVEPSKDDAKFAWGKRPSKASVVAQKIEETV